MHSFFLLSILAVFSVVISISGSVKYSDATHLPFSGPEIERETERKRERDRGTKRDRDTKRDRERVYRQSGTEIDNDSRGDRDKQKETQQ